MAVLRRRSAARTGMGIGALGIATAVGITGTVSPAEAAEPARAAEPTPRHHGGATPHTDDGYTVRAGDTVDAIARAHQTTIAAVVAANDLGPRALIQIGQVLTIPAPGGQPAVTPAPQPANSGGGSYIVRSGDTLTHIAAAHHTTVAALQHANGLRNHLIFPGQELALSGKQNSGGTSTTPASTPQAPTSGGSYIVRSGDTLTHIAAAHQTTVAALQHANGLTSSTIFAGQRLEVTGGPAADNGERELEQLVPSTFLHYSYPDDVVRAANENKHALLALDLPGPTQMREIIRSTAIDMGVDPALALAVSHQESGFQMTAVSPANAIGAMQVIPTSGEWASDMVGRDLNLLDPHDNAVAGVAILRYLVGAAANEQQAIGGYYQGLSSVRSNGLFSDTRRYVANIQTLMTRYG